MRSCGRCVAGVSSCALLLWTRLRSLDRLLLDQAGEPRLVSLALQLLSLAADALAVVLSVSLALQLLSMASEALAAARSNSLALQLSALASGALAATRFVSLAAAELASRLHSARAYTARPGSWAAGALLPIPGAQSGRE